MVEIGDMLVPVDKTWFTQDPERYLTSDKFRRFEDISGVSMRDWASDDPLIKKSAQDNLADQSVIINEIQNLHFGYGFPFFVYTHEFGFFSKVPNHNLELDKEILSLDMCDSLRRRHFALSMSLLPQAITELYQARQKPIIVKNLGSGVGLDCINASVNLNHGLEQAVSCIINYDTNEQAVNLGRKLTAKLEEQGKLKQGAVSYVTENMTKSSEKSDMVVMVGIICGLQDRYARALLYQAYRSLNDGGRIIVSSSNFNMRKSDPLASFIAQHTGMKDDIMKGWGLNFRDSDSINYVLGSVGFKDIMLYDDANFPGRNSISEKFDKTVDTLPSRCMGLRDDYAPIVLPGKETLEKKIGYNWLAVATK